MGLGAWVIVTFGYVVAVVFVVGYSDALKFVVVERLVRMRQRRVVER